MRVGVGNGGVRAGAVMAALRSCGCRSEKSLVEGQVRVEGVGKGWEGKGRSIGSSSCLLSRMRLFPVRSLSFESAFTPTQCGMIDAACDGISGLSGISTPCFAWFTSGMFGRDAWLTGGKRRVEDEKARRREGLGGEGMDWITL